MIVKRPTIAPRKLRVSDLTVEIVQDITALEQHVAAWQDLAVGAAEPNVFYEPWMLLPALRAFGRGKDLQFVLVYAPAPPGSQQAQLLCGFFPLERRRRLRRLPVPNLALWKHLHCHVATPLVRSGFGSAVMTKFFEWLREHHRGCFVLDMPEVSGDGSFMRNLVEGPWQRDAYHRSFSRALLCAGHDADGYMRSTMTGDKRRELQRKRRRLQESAGYRKVTVEGLGEHESPIRDFLALEASGWKGRDQVAMSCHERSRKYFWEIAEAGLQRGQFVLHGIYSKDRPMAMSCDLLAPPGCFGFKTGFDESFSSQAPGVCLVLDHIDFLYARPELEWMDACTSTGNGWVNRLWLDCKIVTSVLVPTGRTGGRLAVSLFPFFRWLRSSSRRVRTRRS